MSNPFKYLGPKIASILAFFFVISMIFANFSDSIKALVESYRALFLDRFGENEPKKPDSKVNIQSPITKENVEQQPRDLESPQKKDERQKQLEYPRVISKIDAQPNLVANKLSSSLISVRIGQTIRLCDSVYMVQINLFGPEKSFILIEQNRRPSYVKRILFNENDVIFFQANCVGFLSAVTREPTALEETLTFEILLLSVNDRF